MTEGFYTPLPAKFVTNDEFGKQVTSSTYFDRLNKADLKARSTTDLKVTSPSFYRTYYQNSWVEFSEDEKKTLTNAVNKANQKLAIYGNLKDIPWNLVKVSHDIEKNYPHTIGDMIVLNHFVINTPENELVKTLIHEKVHVFQRLENLATRQLVTSFGFASLSPAERQNLSEEVATRARANPDLDSHIYIHSVTKTVTAQIYDSDMPTSLADSKAVGYDGNNYYQKVQLTNDLLGLPRGMRCQLEHPFEIMACLIAELIMNPDLTEKEKANMYVDETMKWMTKHFTR